MNELHLSEYSKLVAENAALRAEVERLSALFSSERDRHCTLLNELAISQLEAKRLEGVLDMWLHATVNDRTEYSGARAITRKALSSPTSTEALDAYVAEQETAKACAEVANNIADRAPNNEHSDLWIDAANSIYEAIRSGAWKEFKKS